MLELTLPNKCCWLDFVNCNFACLLFLKEVYGVELYVTRSCDSPIVTTSCFVFEDILRLSPCPLQRPVGPPTYMS